MAGDSLRAASTVVGVLLLVGVVVIVGGVVALGSLTFLDGTGAPQATATFDYEQTPVGLRMSPSAISTAVTVQLNGRDVATFDPDSAGQSVLLPTAPDDRITVVSRDGEQSVLVDRTVDDRSEVGDLIAYYTFEEGDDPTVLEDKSGTDNDGDLVTDGTGARPTWNDGSLEFNGGSDGYVDVQGIDPPEGVDVTSFTIAVAYRQTADPGGVDQLVEHDFDAAGSDNLEWFLETRGSDPHKVDYNVDFPESDIIRSGAAYPTGERHVAVGTYDGSEYTLYVNGAKIGTENHTQEISIENMRIGRDYESNSQYLDGEIYGIRLYYTAFDGEEVQVVTNAME